MASRLLSRCTQKAQKITDAYAIQASKPGNLPAFCAGATKADAATTMRARRKSTRAMVMKFRVIIANGSNGGEVDDPCHSTTRVGIHQLRVARTWCHLGSTISTRRLRKGGDLFGSKSTLNFD